jgi:N-carbamoylputrescine amidase
MRDVTAACIQTPPGGVATPEYVDAVLTGADVELAVLPELSTTPYFPLEPDSRDADAPVRIDALEPFGAVARKHRCHLVLGVYLTDGVHRFNAAALLRPDGKRARSYHKVHLCDVQLPGSSFCETAYFDAGDGYVVWDTPFGCVGVLVCYDRHFPEAWVAVRELGAEIVCVPTTSGMHMEPSFVAEIQAMSLQQSVYALCANRVGVEELRTSGRRTEFLGGSCITGPFGEILASAPYREDVPLVSARLETDGLQRIRAAHQFHEHRRPDTYVTQQEMTA